MGTEERRAREKQLLREEILDAARELFVKDGFENVSMRKIAEKIEYSPTTIYLYFQDKAEILHTLCEETFSKLGAIMARIEHSELPPVERLRRVGEAYIRFGLENPNHYRVTFMMPSLDIGLKSPEELMASPGMRTFETVVNCVQWCVDAGLFREMNVFACAQALWCTVHGLTSLLISQEHFPWVEKDLLIRTMMDGMMHGFLKPEAG